MYLRWKRNGWVQIPIFVHLSLFTTSRGVEPASPVILLAIDFPENAPNLSILSTFPRVIGPCPGSKSGYVYPRIIRF